MTAARNKTVATAQSAAAFLDGVPDGQRRDDARQLCRLMERVTGEHPTMWGASIVGFGRYRYRYDSGREGEWAATGFSPRAKELVVYLMADAADRDALLGRLGRHKVGKSCLYIKRLADVDMTVLETLITRSLAAVRDRYPD